MVLQFAQHVPIKPVGVLFDDLIGHDDLITALDNIATVHNYVGGDALQLEVLADGRIVRNEVLESTPKIVRSISIKQELVLLQLDRHIVSGPDVFL